MEPRKILVVGADAVVPVGKQYRSLELDRARGPTGVRERGMHWGSPGTWEILLSPPGIGGGTVTQRQEAGRDGQEEVGAL